MPCDTLQECREACGGAGFLIENRFASLRADLDVYVTFEGDNTVLLQLVAKRLLADYAKEFRNVTSACWPATWWPGHGDRPSTAPACAGVAQFVADSGSVQKAALAIKDEASQRALLDRPRPDHGGRGRRRPQGRATGSRSSRARRCSTRTSTN